MEICIYAAKGAANWRLSFACGQAPRRPTSPQRTTFSSLRGGESNKTLIRRVCQRMFKHPRTVASWQLVELKHTYAQCEQERLNFRLGFVLLAGDALSADGKKRIMLMLKCA